MFVGEGLLYILFPVTSKEIPRIALFKQCIIFILPSDEICLFESCYIPAPQNNMGL
jgi:hypothetical protein